MGVERPERMTRVELRDEIVRRSVPEERQAEARGLFGVARSMIASVVDKGLNLPDAAKAIRGSSAFEVPVTSQTPVATVTLAEIYAAQGHKARALRILEDVLSEEPGHEEALRVQRELRAGSAGVDSVSTDAQSRERSREALTREAPPVQQRTLRAEPPSDLPGETTEYVPGGFVETTGEEIETGRPPVVEEDEAVFSGPAIDSGATETASSGTGPAESAVGGQIAAEAAPAEDATAEDAIAQNEPVEPAPSDAAPIEARSVALVLSQTPSGLALYWELPDSTLDECSVDRSDGRAVARIVSFSPHGAAPERHEDTIILAETIPVAAPPGCLAGKLRLERHGTPSFVRAALGWESEDGFLPFTVGRALDEWDRVEGGELLAGRARVELP